MLVSRSTISQRKPQLTFSANNADNKHSHSSDNLLGSHYNSSPFPPHSVYSALMTSLV